VSDTDQRMLERVRKLLARAEHPTTPPAEAEACSAKAAELMARHLIDQAMLDPTQARTEHPLARTVDVESPYSMGKAVLLDEVARAFGVRVVFGADRRADGRRCTLFGFATDLAMAELLFTSLLLQASTAMRMASQGHPRVKAFRRAFLFGYAAEIGKRLRDATATAARDAADARPGTDLVLVDRRARVDAAFAEQFPALRSIRPRVSSGNGLMAGRAAGAEADLSAGRRRLDGNRGEISA
jgi:hypothetical protein